MRYGANIVKVTQKISDFHPELLGKNAAYRDWQRRLGRKDTLPRGKFFEGKKPGRPIIVMDECHRLIKQKLTDFITREDDPSNQTMKSIDPFHAHV